MFSLPATPVWIKIIPTESSLFLQLNPVFYRVPIHSFLYAAKTFHVGAEIALTIFYKMLFYLSSRYGD